MIFGIGIPLVNGCWGSGSVYSAIVSLLALALLAGGVVLVYLCVYDHWKKITKK